MFYLMTYSTHFIYIFQWTYGKGPFREVERKSDATTSWKDLQTLDLTLEGRTDMFYLMTYSTHFIYIFQWTYGKGPFREVERKSDATTSWKDLQTLDLTLEGRKDGYVLFNDILNTFYLHLSMDIW